MKRLLIVFHSMTGGARQMAEAVLHGATSEGGVQARLVRAAEATAEDILEADGYVFVTPENLAAMSGIMKDFFDRTYYAALERIAGRPYATLICAGSDGHNAVRQIERICTGWRLKAVCEPIIVCTYAQTPEAILAPKTIGAEDLRRCAETGAAIAAGLALGVF
jgi:multimeric flavodoxin WrbA